MIRVQNHIHIIIKGKSVCKCSACSALLSQRNEHNHNAVEYVKANMRIQRSKEQKNSPRQHVNETRSSICPMHGYGSNQGDPFESLDEEEEMTRKII